MNPRRTANARTPSRRSSREQIELLDSQVQILNALDYPVVRIFPDNRMEFINNAFFEYAEIPEFSQGKPDGNAFRARYQGSSVLDYIPPSDHERFEGMKRKAKQLRSDLQAEGVNTFKVGVAEEFAFVSHSGRRTPVQLSVTYAVKYDKFNLSFADITALKRAEVELKEAHDALEQRVEERTIELQKANEEIRLQTQAILELSTPVVRIRQDIVLMPLIGVIDTQRSMQIEERLLQAVSELQASIAILDVTGVPVIDTSVARHLLTTVSSTRMLGAEVIITGFSPETAQTIVRLGVDFSKLRTRGSLQAGIAEALALTGMTIGSAGAPSRTGARRSDKP